MARRNWVTDELVGFGWRWERARHFLLAQAGRWEEADRARDMANVYASRLRGMGVDVEELQ